MNVIDMNGAQVTLIVNSVANAVARVDRCEKANLTLSQIESIMLEELGKIVNAYKSATNPCADPEMAKIMEALPPQRTFDEALQNAIRHRDAFKMSAQDEDTAIDMLNHHCTRLCSGNVDAGHALATRAIWE